MFIQLSRIITQNYSMRYKLPPFFLTILYERSYNLMPYQLYKPKYEKEEWFLKKKYKFYQRLFEYLHTEYSQK